MREVSHTTRARSPRKVAARGGATARKGASPRKAASPREAATPRVQQQRKPVSVRQLIERGSRQLHRAGVFFGHGTDNAWDEAASLVWHVLNLPLRTSPPLYEQPVTLKDQLRFEHLLQRRIDERIPAPYLTGRTWFAGIPFEVDPRVLIPRSPLAELIERHFAPWIEAERATHILDIGTGSGCIAIACAKYFPKAHVDAVDVSPQALEVARANVRRHRLSKRVEVVKSHYFRALRGRAYDIIVSNPPYVSERELRSLPAEYRYEPRVALAAGSAGLDAVNVILREASRHLRPRGILIVEVGNTEEAVRRAYPRLPFTWLEFERGGGGVFVLTAEQLSVSDRARKIPRRGNLRQGNLRTGHLRRRATG